MCTCAVLVYGCMLALFLAKSVDRLGGQGGEIVLPFGGNTQSFSLLVSHSARFVSPYDLPRAHKGLFAKAIAQSCSQVAGAT